MNLRRSERYTYWSSICEFYLYTYIGYFCIAHYDKFIIIVRTCDCMQKHANETWAASFRCSQFGFGIYAFYVKLSTVCECVSNTMLHNAINWIYAISFGIDDGVTFATSNLRQWIKSNNKTAYYENWSHDILNGSMGVCNVHDSEWGFFFFVFSLSTWTCTRRCCTLADLTRLTLFSMKIDSIFCSYCLLHSK